MLPTHRRRSCGHDPWGNRWSASFAFHVRLHVHFLDLTTGKLLFDVEVQANQTKHNAHRLRVEVGGVYGEGVHHVLQDQSTAQVGLLRELQDACVGFAPVQVGRPQQIRNQR